MTTAKRKFAKGDRVRKHSGTWWEGRVVGFYSTADNPLGYNVQLDMVPNGPVQIYPEAALELAPMPADYDEVERISTEAAISQWERSLKRPDLTEKDRVLGAVQAYKRQAFAFRLVLVDPGPVEVGEVPHG